jgi:hypothetical protein
MARSVQISGNYSVKHEPNFLIFLLPFFSISQIKKFGGLRKYALTSIKQLISYELYTLLATVFYSVIVFHSNLVFR